MDFDRCIEIVLKHEGGYTWDAFDPGGETKFGIAKAFYPYLDIKELTLEQAKGIYKTDYWDRHNVEALPECLRLAYFDCVVNQGGFAAKILLQRVLGVTQDGIMGPKTLLAAYSYGPELVARYLTERALRYTKTRNFDRFGKGWLYRIFDVAMHSDEGPDG